MSKQTNDQDEKKSPSGESPSGKRREADDTTGGDSRKNRASPRDQSSQQGGGADKPADTPPDRSGSDNKVSPEKASSAAEPDKTTTRASTTPSGKGKAAAAAGKPADDKPAAGKASKAGSPPSDTPKAAGGGGGPTPPPAGGGQGGGKKGGGKSGALALVLVVLLAIALGFFAQLVWQRMDAQQQRLAELESRTDSVATADDLAELESQVESRLDAGQSERNAQLSDALDELRERFASYRSEIDGTLDQVLDELSSEQDTDEREWLHAEAAYLLRLANQRLQLERDVEGAIALLRTADERLSEADNPALLSVRRAIASEIAILDGVPQVDRTGIYLALNAQQERLATLPLSRELEEIPARSGIEEAPSGGWERQLSRFGQELKDLVVVRHHDEALESLISPEQESYLRQSVRLVLEQAQLALLKEEQALYEASLDKVLTLLDGYYDTESEEVQSVVERLESLKDETIRPELPDISGSQQALAEFIERRFGSRDEGDDA